MNTRFLSPKDLPPRYQAQAEAALGGKPAPKPSKYRNVRTQYKGRWYDSKGQAEARAWLDSEPLIIMVIDEPSFPLFSRRIQPDFIAMNRKAECLLLDFKPWDRKTGTYRETPLSKNKRAEFFKLYGWKIRIISKRGDEWIILD